MVAKSFVAVATKDDLKALTAEINQKFATKDDLKRFATKDDLKKFATKDDLKTFKDEIIHEFNVVAENIHKDVAGANADEISLIKNQKLPDHEQRIQRIEKKLDLPVGQAS